MDQGNRFYAPAPSRRSRILPVRFYTDKGNVGGEGISSPEGHPTLFQPGSQKDGLSNSEASMISVARYSGSRSE